MSLILTGNQYRFSVRSIDNLQRVHPALVLITGLALALSPVDFGVIDGIRTMEEQQKLFAAGKTRTMNSRHLTGHAIDLGAYVGAKLSWDWSYYEQIAVAMKQAARTLGIPLEWGGDWTTFKDGPHFQLPRNLYP